MQLHLCMICGRDNRREYIRHTLSFSIPVFDRIHVLDTGSTDGSERLASMSGKVSWRYWDHWSAGWGDAYDRVRAEVPEGDWFLYLDSDETPSARLLKHVRRAVERIDREGYGQARIPKVLHMDGRPVGDRADALPANPEEFSQNGVWTKAILCRNGKALEISSFGMHAGFEHRNRPTTYLPLYYCHHKHADQVHAAISIGSFLLPESHDVPIGRAENRVLKDLADKYGIENPGELVRRLQNDLPEEFRARLESWGDSDLETCRHWHSWYRLGFQVGGYPMLLCDEECCSYDGLEQYGLEPEPGTIARLAVDRYFWRVADRYVLKSRTAPDVLCNDAAAAVISRLSGDIPVAAIVDNIQGGLEKTDSAVYPGVISVLSELARGGAVRLRSSPGGVIRRVSEDIDRAVDDALIYWRRRGGWSTGDVHEVATAKGWIVVEFRDGASRVFWNGNETGRCRKLSPYLQRIAIEFPELSGTFAIDPHDTVTHHPDFPLLGFSRRRSGQESEVLIPDAYFISGYARTNRRVDEASRRHGWTDKLPIAFWRGSSTGQANHRHNLDGNLRVGVCSMSARYPRLIDARFSSPAQCTEEAARELQDRGLLGTYLPEHAQLAYRYLLNIDGNSSAWGATYWKLRSNSVMVQVGRDEFETPGLGLAEHEQWYHVWLRRDEHFLSCTPEGLPDLVRWMQDHDADCRRIAAEATRFVHEYLSRSAAREYTGRLLLALARLAVR